MFLNNFDFGIYLAILAIGWQLERWSEIKDFAVVGGCSQRC